MSQVVKQCAPSKVSPDGVGSQKFARAALDERSILQEFMSSIANARAKAMLRQVVFSFREAALSYARQQGAKAMLHKLVFSCWEAVSLRGAEWRIWAQHWLQEDPEGWGGRSF